MAAPWWQFPRIDNLGAYPDPEGPYYKPDSNIQLPPGYPIAAISSGTVTSVQKTSWGQWVVTVRLDSPINKLATHQFYEHMSRATVSVGQHVNQGDLIGANNQSGPPLGFGFYSGDIYGSGSAWQTLQNDLAAYGDNSLLSPVAFLDQMSGQAVPPSSNSSSGGVLSFLQQISLPSIPIIIGALVVVAVLLGVFLLWKEIE